MISNCSNFTSLIANFSSFPGSPVSISYVIGGILVAIGTIALINYARALNKNVKNETVKKELLNKLEELKTYIDIKEDIDKIKINFDESTYNSIENRIKKVKDSDVKTKLEK